MLLASALAAATLATSSIPAAAQTADRPALDEGHRLFYNGRYEAAAALALQSCTAPPLDLNACELATSALHFQIRKALDTGNRSRGRPAGARPYWRRSSRRRAGAGPPGRAQGGSERRCDAVPAGKLDLSYAGCSRTLGKKIRWKKSGRRGPRRSRRRRPDISPGARGAQRGSTTSSTRLPRHLWVLGGGAPRASRRP
jgi:hypothetical protein